MRILAIDFGTKRIGLALSDPLGYTAQGLETLMRQNKKQVIAFLMKLCKENGVGEVVIGLPINMNGSTGPKAQEILDLVPELEKALEVPVHTWDERLTSREADRLMIEQDLSRQKQKQNSDRLAATMILQGYPETKRRSRGV